MKSSMLRSCLPLFCLWLFLSPGPAPADQPFADLALHTEAIVFQPTVEAAGFTLTVSTPDGLVVRKEFGPRDTPSFSLADLQGANLDGTYSYQLEMRPLLSPEQRNLMDRARQANEEVRARIAGRLSVTAPSQFGYFTVYQGAIVPASLERDEEAPDGAEGQDWATSGGLQSAPEKTVISGDLTVYNALCVGFDCLSAESYGADSIRLKENNLRIHFDDTSAAGFPANDWRIVANSNLSGGGSFLAFEDSTAGRQVFTVEAGASTNSLYVDTGNRVGIGTGTPVLNLHVATGNTPALRLEQNTSSGFAAQTWDIAGNETSFFIRDVTGGSQLPLRIFPGADTNSLTIAASNDVGVGTASPAARLHVTGTNNPKVLIEDTVDDANDKTGFTLRSPAADSAGDWTFEVNNNGNFQIDFGPSPGAEILLTDSTATNSTVTIAGNLVVNGICTGCDAVFQPGFDLESVEEHAAFMFEHSHLPSVGPTPEGNTPIDVYQKTTGILQELEKAHIYIAQLHERLRTEADRRVEMEARNEDLLRRLENVEALLMDR